MAGESDGELAVLVVAFHLNYRTHAIRRVADALANEWVRRIALAARLLRARSIGRFGGLRPSRRNVTNTANKLVTRVRILRIGFIAAFLACFRQRTRCRVDE